MKLDFKQEVNIPDGCKVEFSSGILKIKKDDKEITREFSGFNMEIKDNLIILSKKKSTKNDKTAIRTATAHIKNMLEGVGNLFTYKLQICSTHFPMTVEKKGSQLVIKNFLGERHDRVAKLLTDVDVKVEGDQITIESHDKEKAGQTAANIESATRINNRDRRRFQDGIYITEKAGKEI